MGEGGEAAEVFKSLFGGFSGSLSLFTNNPYQRASAAAEEAPAFESVKKGKKKVVEEFKEAEVEVAAEKKKSKKKDTENAVDAQLQEEVKSKKKKKKSVEAAVVVEDAPPSGKTPVKEKRAKRKVVEEEIREEFEEKFRGSDGKKAKSESLVVHSEDPEIDHILHESLQEENKTQGKRKFLDDDDGVAVPSKKKPKKTKKEVEEEEEKLLRTVFVGNLPTTVKKKQIIREFSQFGKVASARLRSIALVDTKLPRKAAVITGQVNEKRTSQNAYVVFEEVESAKAALVHNMAEFQGKHIRVDMASAPRKDSKPGIDTAAEYDRTRSLFVGNVPFEVEEEDLYKVFANDNPELSVEAIRVPRDPQTSISKGFGFVLFKTKAGANAALAKKSTKIGERYLRVVKMGSQQRLKKQSAPPAGSFRNNATAGKRLSEGGSGATPPGKKGPLPWEGARVAKSDGKPGKGALGRLDTRRTSQGGSAGKASGDPAPKVRLTKRPAVLARKQAQLFKAGKGPPPPKPKSKNVKGGGRSNPKNKAK